MYTVHLDILGNIHDFQCIAAIDTRQLKYTVPPKLFTSASDLGNYRFPFILAIRITPQAITLSLHSRY